MLKASWQESVSSSHDRADMRCALLIGALNALWRIGRIPVAGGRPVGRPGKWIRSEKSSYAAHRRPALVGRGIAAIRSAPSISGAPCTGIRTGRGEGEGGQREYHKKCHSNNCPLLSGLWVHVALARGR